MRGEARISPVYQMAEPTRERDPLQEWGRLDAMRRHAWQQSGFVAVRPEDLPDDLRTKLTRWAERQYGKRKA